MAVAPAGPLLARDPLNSLISNSKRTQQQMAKQKAEEEKSLRMDAVPVRDCGPLDENMADTAKYYNVSLQLGCKTRWGRYGGGRWQADPTRDVPGKKAYLHIHAVHKVGPISGDTVNGLILKHNAFIEANHANESPRGDVGRTVLLLDMEETTPPVLKRVGLPFDIEDLIAKVAEGVATATVKAVLAAKAT